MNAQFIRFQTKDNLLLQGMIYHSSQPTQKAYLHIHGMGGNFYENRFLDVMAEGVTTVGYAFASVNTRGHDQIADIPVVGKEQSYKRIGNAFERFEDSVLDIEGAINHLEREEYTEIILCGHSLGSVKAAHYLATTHDSRVSRLVLMSPPDMISLAEADEGRLEFLETAVRMTEEGRGEELMPKLLWDEYYLSPQTYLNLSTRDLPVDVFNFYDPAKPSTLREIKVPILAFLGEHDDAVTIPQRTALELIRQKAIAAPSIDLEIIAGANHGYFGKEAEMTKVITNWL